MDVKIGIQHIAREVTVETDQSAEEIASAYRKAVAEGTTFELTDTKGGRTLVRADAVAYLDLGSEKARKVGFGL